MSDTDATKPTEAAAPQVEDKPVEQPTPAANEGVKDEAKEETKEETKGDVEAQPEAGEATANGATSVLKTTAKHDHDNPKNNRKFDPSTREVTDDPVAIRKQVEFYFGDWNFPQDKFMWESCGGSENKPMPIKAIHSFKRMRTFQPYSAVVAALRDSATLDVGGEEGEETIKRKEAYKPMGAGKAKSEASTVYVKGFGDEKPNTQFDLESFFANYGEVKGLKLRRTTEALFKGSVFVTFADEETAKKFLELDPAPQWESNDLKIMSKHAYCEEKSDLIRQGKLEPNSQQPRKFFEGTERGGGRGGRGRGGFRGDNDDWKNRRDHDQKNGFKDRRGGRGGRGGRGRGGRGRGDRDRGPREDRRERAPAQDAAAEELKESTKRSRDEDGGAGEEPAAKKVDTKTEVAAES